MSSSVSARFRSFPLSSRFEDRASRPIASQNCSSECDDEVLIARVQAGDRDALAQVFRRYAHPIRNVGQRILRDRAEADDLVQEVFLYIHRKSSLFDSSKGSARSWIVQVAYTQAFLRRRLLKSKGFYVRHHHYRGLEKLRKQLTEDELNKRSAT
jgi:RNA polymerase sigma-70 factor (ECF subfamily)